MIEISSFNLNRKFMVFSMLLLFLYSTIAICQEKETEKIVKSKLIQELSIAVSSFMSVAEMQRYYEAVRIASDFKTKQDLINQMRSILEKRVIPISRVKELSGTVPVSCTPQSSMDQYGCFTRDTALAHIYFGLARALQGMPGYYYLHHECAKQVFPGIDQVEIYLKRPPEISEDYEPDLNSVKEEVYPVKLAVKLEKTKWPKDVYPVKYDFIPSPALVPSHLKLNKYNAKNLINKSTDKSTDKDNDISSNKSNDKSIIKSNDNNSDSNIDKTIKNMDTNTVKQFISGLDLLIIKPVAVNNKYADYYAETAVRDLKLTISRLYEYNWLKLGTEQSSVCPDPRVFFLPVGEYVMYIKGTNDFNQNFFVNSDSNNFLFEYFYVGDFESNTASPRIAWYIKSNLGN